MEDIFSILLTVGLTLGLGTLIGVVIGNLFLKKAFEIAGQLLTGVIEKPAVAKAFGILGKRSGESRRNKALENQIAGGVIDATIGKWKIPLKIIGVDLDELLQDYEPLELLQTLQTFLPMLQGAGIDISQLNPESLLSGGQKPPSKSSNSLSTI